MVPYLSAPVARDFEFYGQIAPLPTFLRFGIPLDGSSCQLAVESLDYKWKNNAEFDATVC